MKSLAEVGHERGQWFTVLSAVGSDLRIVVRISEHNPHLALLSSGHATGVGNLFDPILISKEEAGVLLNQEIDNFEKLVVTSSEKALKEVLLIGMREFKKRNF